MKSNVKKIKQSRSHTNALQMAIANLEKFVSKNESLPLMHVADLAVQEGRLIDADQSQLKKTLGFITSLFSNRTRTYYQQKRLQVQGVVLRAIDVIKRNHLLIEHLSHGTPEEKALAVSTLNAVKRYNAVLDSADSAVNDWKQRVASFFYKNCGLTIDDSLKNNRIDLPATHAFHCKLSEDSSSQKISHAFQNLLSNPSSVERPEFTAVMLTTMMADPLSKQEIDLLRMKASTLLRQKGIRFHSMAEALQAIKEAPIHTILDSKTSIATLRLILTLVPGMTIEIQGAFQRHPQSLGYSTPISESFHLVFQSFHNGFPHPLQYNGWAFGNALIPTYPHRLDQMPLFRPLYERKQEVMTRLLPDGDLLEKARNLWKCKQQTFCEHLETFLKLHRELSIAILSACPEKMTPADGEHIVNSYFDHLELQASKYDYLAATHAMINFYYIERPFAKLQEIWLTRQETDGIDSLQQKIKHVFEVDRALLEQQLDEKLEQSEEAKDEHVLAYVRCLGSALQNSFHTILLQTFSETFGCPPKMLNDFDQKVQAVAYKQLMTFLDELTGNVDYGIDFGLEDCVKLSPSNAVSRLKMKDHLLQSLESDIALFKIDSCDDLDTPSVQIVQELEIYFNTRYYSSL